MKKYFAVLMLAVLFASCTSDDDDTNAVDLDVSTGNYLPLTDGNYWKYNVGGDLQTGSDSLYIQGDVALSGHTYKRFQTDEPAIGFYSSALSNNGVRKEGDRLLLNGTAMMSFVSDFPLTINLDDFVILNESEPNGAVLATVSGSIPYVFEGYTFNFNYTLTSSAMEHQSTFTTPDGEAYNDVKPVMLKLNVSVETVLTGGGFSIPVTIMAPQDVIVSTRYFAKDVGVVYSSTDIHYELEDFASNGVQLPMPQSFSAEQDEILVEYQAD